MFTIFKLIVPAARSGIMTGVILGVARALGNDGNHYGYGVTPQQCQKVYLNQLAH